MGEENNGVYGMLGEIVVSGRITSTGDWQGTPSTRTGGYITNDDWTSFLIGLSDWNRLPPIERVIFSGPATIVLWADDSPKTVVKLQPGDSYSKELGLAMCICKKALGNKGKYNNIFHEWVYNQEDEEEDEKFEDPFRDITDIDQFLKSILF